MQETRHSGSAVVVPTQFLAEELAAVRDPRTGHNAAGAVIRIWRRMRAAGTPASRGDISTAVDAFLADEKRVARCNEMLAAVRAYARCGGSLNAVIRVLRDEGRDLSAALHLARDAEELVNQAKGMATGSPDGPDRARRLIGEATGLL